MKHNFVINLAQGGAREIVQQQLRVLANLSLIPSTLHESLRSARSDPGAQKQKTKGVGGKKTCRPVKFFLSDNGDGGRGEEWRAKWEGGLDLASNRFSEVLQ